MILNEKALKATVIVDITSRFNSERLRPWREKDWRETAQANVNADLIKFQFLKAHKAEDFLFVLFLPNLGENSSKVSCL